MIDTANTNQINYDSINNQQPQINYNLNQHSNADNHNQNINNNNHTANGFFQTQVNEQQWTQKKQLVQEINANSNNNYQGKTLKNKQLNDNCCEMADEQTQLKTIQKQHQHSNTIEGKSIEPQINESIKAYANQSIKVQNKQPINPQTNQPIKTITPKNSVTLPTKISPFLLNRNIGVDQFLLNRLYQNRSLPNMRELQTQLIDYLNGKTVQMINSGNPSNSRQMVIDPYSVVLWQALVDLVKFYGVQVVWHLRWVWAQVLKELNRKDGSTTNGNTNNSSSSNGIQKPTNILINQQILKCMVKIAKKTFNILSHQQKIRGLDFVLEFGPKQNKDNKQTNTDNKQTNSKGDPIPATTNPNIPHQQRLLLNHISQLESLILTLQPTIRKEGRHIGKSLLETIMSLKLPKEVIQSVFVDVWLLEMMGMAKGIWEKRGQVDKRKNQIIQDLNEQSKQLENASNQNRPNSQSQSRKDTINPNNQNTQIQSKNIQNSTKPHSSSQNRANNLNGNNIGQHNKTNMNRLPSLGLKLVQPRNYQLNPNTKVNPNLNKSISNREDNSIMTTMKSDQSINTPICCRTFFLSAQTLLQSEGLTLIYRYQYYPFPDDFHRYLAKIISALLNRRGGVILLTVEAKQSGQACIGGQILNQNDKRNLQSSIEYSVSLIRPKILTAQLVKVVFIPIKSRNPPNNFIAGFYVPKIIVSEGPFDQFYSLAGNHTVEQFFCKTQVKVLKLDAQEVLQTFKQNMIRRRQLDPNGRPAIGMFGIHDGPCKIPLKGSPLHANIQQQQEQQLLHVFLSTERNTHGLETLRNQAKHEPYGQSIRNLNNEAIGLYVSRPIAKRLSQQFQLYCITATIALRSDSNRKVVQSMLSEYPKIADRWEHIERKFLFQNQEMAAYAFVYLKSRNIHVEFAE